MKNNTEHKPKPDKTLKEWIAIWDQYFENQTGFKYSYAPKDFVNIKLLKAKICQVDTSGNNKASFESFLNSISYQWHLQNLSIPLINSHFNQLLIQAKKHERPRTDYTRFFK